MTHPSEARYRSLSFWLDTVPGSLAPRAPLPGDVDVDVAVVGAGYTGLWTALELARADPSLRVVVVEREVAGFGASGRNGGWCSGLFAAGPDAVARHHGRGAAVAMTRAMFAAVDEVGRAAAAEGIDCHFHKGGTFVAAVGRPQVERLRAELAHHRSWGLGEDDYRWLEAGEAPERIRVAGAGGALYTPHCAALHPARLARGLAEAVERRGVAVHERTPVLEIAPGVVRTAAGRIRADVVVRATEAYTPSLAHMRRRLVPLYSLMIVTEALPEAFWAEVGWADRETFADGRLLIIYAQRTADGRIAFGGRGAPYHFGSGIRDEYDRVPKVFEALRGTMRKLFPATGHAAVTHQWGGPVGVPRDWFSSVGYDTTTGLAWAGGYVGDGVSTTNLAGRTLADLILRRDTDLVHLPWVGHRSPNWEPEPLRWLGVNAGLWLTTSADAHEARTGRRARLRGAALRRVLGH